MLWRRLPLVQTSVRLDSLTNYIKLNYCISSLTVGKFV